MKFRLLRIQQKVKKEFFPLYQINFKYNLFQVEYQMGKIAVDNFIYIQARKIESIRLNSDIIILD